MKKIVLRDARKCSPIEQLGKPYEHEAWLKQLLQKRDELKRALDLEKGERHLAPDEADDPEGTENPPPARAGFILERTRDAAPDASLQAATPAAGIIMC